MEDDGELIDPAFDFASLIADSSSPEWTDRTYGGLQRQMKPTEKMQAVMKEEESKRREERREEERRPPPLIETFVIPVQFTPAERGPEVVDFTTTENEAKWKGGLPRRKASAKTRRGQRRKRPPEREPEEWPDPESPTYTLDAEGEEIIESEEDVQIIAAKGGAWETDADKITPKARKRDRVVPSPSKRKKAKTQPLVEIFGADLLAHSTDAPFSDADWADEKSPGAFLLLEGEPVLNQDDVPAIFNTPDELVFEDDVGVAGGYGEPSPAEDRSQYPSFDERPVTTTVNLRLPISPSDEEPRNVLEDDNAIITHANAENLAPRLPAFVKYVTTEDTAQEVVPPTTLCLAPTPPEAAEGDASSTSPQDDGLSSPSARVLFVCPRCKRKNTSKEAVWAHMLNHLSPERWICFRCLAKVESIDFLDVVEGRVYCNSCAVALRSQIPDPPKRLGKGGNVTPYQCNRCSFATDKVGNFKRHLQVHDKSAELYSCPQCPLTFGSIGSFANHMALHQVPEKRILPLTRRHSERLHSESVASPQSPTLPPPETLVPTSVLSTGQEQYMQSPAGNPPPFPDEGRMLVDTAPAHVPSPLHDSVLSTRIKRVRSQPRVDSFSKRQRTTILPPHQLLSLKQSGASSPYAPTAHLRRSARLSSPLSTSSDGAVPDMTVTDSYFSPPNTVRVPSSNRR